MLGCESQKERGINLPLLFSRMPWIHVAGRVDSALAAPDARSREFTLSSSLEMTSAGTWRDSVHGAARLTSEICPPGSGAAGAACCHRDPTVQSILEEKSLTEASLCISRPGGGVSSSEQMPRHSPCLLHPSTLWDISCVHTQTFSAFVSGLNPKRLQGKALFLAL